MSTMTALAGSELKLYVREWGTLVFAFVFPPLMMLILAGVFAGDDPEAFGPMNGSDHYIVSYFAVPLAAVALTTLPVMMAGYAEAGVLKRYGASGVGALRVVTAQAATCLVSVLAGAGLVLAVAAPVYGVPAVQRPLEVLAVLALGVPMMLTLGVGPGAAGEVGPRRQRPRADALLPHVHPRGRRPTRRGDDARDARHRGRAAADTPHRRPAPGLAARPLRGPGAVVAPRLVGRRRRRGRRGGALARRARRVNE